MGSATLLHRLHHSRDSGPGCSFLYPLCLAPFSLIINVYRAEWERSVLAHCVQASAAHSPAVPRLPVRMMPSWSKMPASDWRLCSPGLRTVTRGKGDLHTDLPYTATGTKIQKEENESLYSGAFYNLECSNKDERGNSLYGCLTGEPWPKGWFWESTQRKWLLAHGSHYDTDGVCGWYMNVAFACFQRSGAIRDFQ
jgi:hypothetical protein